MSDLLNYPFLPLSIVLGVLLSLGVSDICVCVWNTARDYLAVYLDRTQVLHVQQMGPFNRGPHRPFVISFPD